MVSFEARFSIPLFRCTDMSLWPTPMLPSISAGKKTDTLQKCPSIPAKATDENTRLRRAVRIRVEQIEIRRIFDRIEIDFSSRTAKDGTNRPGLPI